VDFGRHGLISGGHTESRGKTEFRGKGVDMDAETHRSYHRGRWHRLENALMSTITRVGMVPNSYLLTTIGRKTGRRRTNPVTIVDLDGHRWLVAPYGVVPWVLNARASGDVVLTRGRHHQRFTIRAASAEESGPVLKRYLNIASATRSYFTAHRDSPPEEFVKEAHEHPVFELLPVEIAT
jgi:deazaflavin-dependent oxidoreductase (nitroreductase family)